MEILLIYFQYNSAEIHQERLDFYQKYQQSSRVNFIHGRDMSVTSCRILEKYAISEVEIKTTTWLSREIIFSFLFHDDN
jgi:hypothetical protein